MIAGQRKIFTALLLIVLLYHASAQIVDTSSTPTDSLPPNASESISIASDDSGLDQTVFYYGKDSTVTDVENQTIHLYKDAYIRYGEMEVKADYIRFSFSDYTLFAKGLPDSSGKLIGRPVFKDGESEFDEDSAAYNFKTKRGISYGAVTQEGEAFLHSQVSKKQDNGWIHIKNGMLTTCDKPKPHYAFKLSKAIVIPNDKVVSGPLYMVVGKVPTPLALPFGFFPNKRESTHGILLPGYGNGQEKGYFLQNLGYYIPIQPYLETKFLFDIYSRGSWNLTNQTNYKRIYKYNGGVEISRTVNLSSLPELPSFNRTVDFNVKWNHRQDQKARPGTTFSALVNAGTRNNFRNNLNSSQQDYLSNTFSSAIQWGKAWKNANLGAAARHSQNTQTGQVDVTLPSLTFSRNRFDLLKWFDKNPSRKTQIGIQYSSSFDNLLSAGDSLYNWQNVDELSRKTENGLRQQVTASTSFGGLIKISPSASYSNVVGFKALEKTYSPQLDTIVTDTVSRLMMGHNFNTAISASWRWFGTLNFKGKSIKAIRHVVNPTIGVSYTPFFNYDKLAIAPADSLNETYNPWELSRYAPSNTLQAGSINFGLGNNLEMKVRDKSQTKVAYKKVSIIDNFSMRGSYNMMADSLRYSNISMTGFTTILKDYKLHYTSSYSLYDRDTLGREINEYVWTTQQIPMRMERTTLSSQVVFSSEKFKRKNKKEEEKPQEEPSEEAQEMINSNPDAYVNLDIPWSLNLDYNLILNKQFDKQIQADKFVVTQSLGFAGSISLMKKVALTFNSGWDFDVHDFTVTSLGASVDLHCWQLTGTWIPFGERKSYMVQLNIKSSLLRDLKVQKRGQYGDATNYLSQ